MFNIVYIKMSSITLNKKYEQINKEEVIPSSKHSNYEYNFNFPIKKYNEPKSQKIENVKFQKFKVYKNYNQNNKQINLLDIFNDNINAKAYFENYNKKKNQNEKKQINNLNNINNLTNLTNYQIHNDNNSVISDYFSFSSDFSDSEEKEEIKKKREEIIKKMSQKTDDLILIDPDFDIFDYSKLIDFSENEFLEEKKNDSDDENKSNKSTQNTDAHNYKIELIKKRIIRDLENAKERLNKFKRLITKKINEKSKSINRNKERSRSKSSKII